MGEKMKLKDIFDMEEYLAKRCYCPGEIYSFGGMFYRIFDAGAECTEIIKGFDERSQEECVVVSAHAHFPGINEDSSNPLEPLELLCIYADPKTKKVSGCTRCDATENNIALVTELYGGGSTERKLDEYEPGAMARATKQVMDMADIIGTSGA